MKINVIVEKTASMEETIKACKSIVDGVEIIRFNFGLSYDDIGKIISVESCKYNDIPYIDIRFTIDETVCFEFVIENPKEQSTDIKEYSSNIKGYWNVFGVTEEDELVDFTDFYNEFFYEDINEI